MEKEDILTEQEIETIIMQLAKGQGEFTEADAAAVIKWAKRVRISNIIMEQVAEGKLLVKREGRKLKFKNP